MNEEDKIGKKIKERLEGHEFPVSGKLWEAISTNLPPQIAGKPIDIATKNVARSSSTVNTSFIITLSLLSIAAIVAIGLYLSSYRGKQTTSVSSVPEKPLLPPTQQPVSKEQALTDADNKSKSSRKNEVKKRVPFVTSNTNTSLKSSADTHRNEVENRTVSKELAVENNTVYVRPKESYKDSVISAKDKKNINKNHPTTSRTKTGSILKKGSYERINRKEQTTYDVKDTLELHSDSQGRVQIINPKNENIEKSKSTLLTSHLKESQQSKESIYLNPDQPTMVDKPTARLTAGILRIENYNTLHSTQEVANQVLTKYAKYALQIGFSEKQFSKANRQAKEGMTESENKIIPTKNKRVFTFSDLSVDALINTQYALPKAMSDSTGQDLTTHIQARKAIASGGIRINYHFPLRRGFLTESKLILSSGIMLERVQNGYTYTYKHTSIDSTYMPVYEWHQSSSGDSIKVIVDTLLSTSINKQIHSFTHQQKVAYMGVPLTFSYNWHKNKWSFYITAGAQMNILLNTQTTITSGDTLQNIPSLEVLQRAYRRVIPLVIANAGIRYKIREQLSFIIEPSFKYALQTIYKPHYALHPRLVIVGITTGIRYKF